MSDESKPAVQIRTQRTPNPNAWKFIVDLAVKHGGKVSYSDVSQCEHVPLAVALLNLANVTQVHFFDNVLTVTQNGGSDWGVLARSVDDVILTQLPTHDPEFEEKSGKPKASARPPLSPELAQIEAILEREVRPALQADGGDLEVLELDGNILTVHFEGACGSCPSSMMGTLQGIESILRGEFNPYLEVVAL